MDVTFKTDPGAGLSAVYAWHVSSGSAKDAGGGIRTLRRLVISPANPSFFVLPVGVAAVLDQRLVLHKSRSECCRWFLV